MWPIWFRQALNKGHPYWHVTLCWLSATFYGGIGWAFMVAPEWFNHSVIAIAWVILWNCMQLTLLFYVADAFARWVKTLPKE